MNVNFLRVELCECEIPETELSIANVNIMRAELCECEFKRAELCECKLYVS